MSGRQLFRKRLIQEWKFQWGVLRSVFDWTIILYMAIPAMILIPFLYADVWKNIHLYWSEEFPFSILLLLVLLLSTRGNFRTYVREADLLYVIQRKKLFYQLKLHSFLFSVFQLVAGVALIFIVILPIVIRIYQFSPMEVLLLFLEICAFRLLFLTLKKIMNRALYKWIFFPLTFIVTARVILYTDSVILGVLSIVIIFIIVMFHLTKIIKTNRLFYKEIEIEHAERIRYIKLILNFSMEVEKEITDQRKKPVVLFRKSRRIFKKRNSENGLLELLIKAFLRNKSHLILYCQFVIVTMYAITVSPVVLKWIVFLCSCFAVNDWLKALYTKMLDNSFFAVVPFEQELTNVVWFRFKRWIALPAVIFIGVFTLIMTLI
ncbi:hypothetical protein DCC39_12320 [Pueribacillus theae]|uniref:ABC transporter permease n=1 Tax=Pueribacillus theae TaxID=2171751 RepID=A0A2U1JXQ9_9BACI|nr:ABC transporter permease [Pueribacillus theae]PWA09744.1 hypothetical protein DCC39_12320 [Pueribacillus theae]